MLTYFLLRYYNASVLINYGILFVQTTTYGQYLELQKLNRDLILSLLDIYEKISLTRTAGV